MNTTNSTHFLQSKPWMMFQQNVGKTTISDRGTGWHYAAIVEPGGGLTRLYTPYGPEIIDENSFKAALVSLRCASKKHGADYVRLQPRASVISSELASKYGLRKIEYSQPAHTWCIDLTSSIDEIFAAMKQNTRNICKNYTKKGMTYRHSNDPTDITTLTHLLKGVADTNKIAVHDDAYFAAQAKSLMEANAASLHFIDLDNVPIAAALVYQADNTWYYAHAAADYEHRKLGASTALLGQILLSAKQAGAQTFDMYGITDSTDPDHKWAGFTRFKKSFGGYGVLLGDTYELPINRTRYALFRLLRSLHGLMSR